MFAAVKLQCDSDVGELWIALAINHDLQGGMVQKRAGKYAVSKTDTYLQSSGLSPSQAHRHLGGS